MQLAKKLSITQIVMPVLSRIITFVGVSPFLFKQADKVLYKAIIGDKKFLKEVQQKKYEFFSSIFHCVSKNMKRGYISKKAVKKILSIAVKGSLANKRVMETVQSYKEKYGIYPPSFIVLSPTQKCNLKCPGCYASSAIKTLPSLPYDIIDRIIMQVRDLFGANAVVISGGEPFIYRDGNKGLFDIWKKYNDIFFLVYTNGTCITSETAKRLAELGNVTPAISVEGLEKETDARRGKGTHRMILNAFKNLRESGVPFGISVTATSKNADVLLSDSFYKYYFDEQGASYMWSFQLMPIGRAKSAFDLMVKPKQRLALYRKWEDLLKKKYCIADFWNSGVLSNGCLAYGRGGGYLYIDWNGNIMPCVFVPYYLDNVYDLFKEGKTLADALFSKFFKRGRDWQSKYCLANPKHAENGLMPCSIRDHYENFRKNILTKDARGENREAEDSLHSKEYYKRLMRFDKEVHKLTDNIWEMEYVKKG